MAEQRPNNFGEAFFKALGQSVGALPGILEQEKQKQLEMLQFSMNKQLYDMQLEEAKMKLNIARAGQANAIKLAGMTTEEVKIEEAQNKAAADRAYIQDITEGLYTQATGKPTAAPFQSALSGLQQTPGLPAFDFKLSSGGGFEVGGQAPIDFAAMGFVPTGGSFNPVTGSQGISYGIPAENKPLTPAELRAQQKEGERLDKDAVIEQASAVYQQIPLDIRQKLGLGDITKYEDLAKLLINPLISGEKRKKFGIDFFAKDEAGLPEIYQQLQALSRAYQAIGKTGGLLKSGSSPTKERALDLMFSQ